MPIRVLNGDGIGSVENLISGVAYAVSHNARIINMSFGCTVKSSALNDVLDSAEAAGIVLVASAGNDNSSFATAPTVSRGTISVAALEADNTKSPYSDFGSFVSVSAPGTVQSTYWGEIYATWSGTSFSAPFVSAEAALILSVKSTITGDQARTLIRNTCTSVDIQNPSYRGKLGRGIIDIEKAVKSAYKL